MRRKDPPKPVSKFFSWLCRQAHLEGLEGDLFELFERRLQRHGYLRASLFYFYDVLTLIRSEVVRSFFINSKPNYMGIFDNYLKTAIRHLWKGKSFAAINLLGLTLGITSVLFIGLYVSHEVRFDHNISNPTSKYRIYNEKHMDDGLVSNVSIVPPMFAQALDDNFSQVERVGRVFLDYDGSIFSIGKNVFSEKNGIYAESEALEILDLEMVSGSLSGLSDHKSILLSESIFYKFFGDVQLNNQTVMVNGDLIQVIGVFKDFPKQSHLHPNYIFSFQILIDRNPNRMKSWTMQQFTTYFELKEDVDATQFELLFQDFVSKQSKKFTAKYSYYYIPHFQNVTEIHLNSSDFEGDIADLGNYQSIKLLSFAASIILLIAILNFINLTTAQAMKRVKEVGIRKFVGASQTQLLFQYIMESCIYSFFGGVISLIGVILLLPYFNIFTGNQFTLIDIFQPIQLIAFFGGLLLIGVISGWYPALLIIRFQPKTALHGSAHMVIGTGPSNIKFNGRQLLVGVQYVLSIGLVLISLIIQKQFRFLQARDMGFSKENIMVIQLTPNMMKDLEATKASFLNFNGVGDVTFSFGVPGGLVANDGIVIPSIQDDKIQSRIFAVAPNYLTTMGMEIVAGRNFSSDLQTDVLDAFIVNETAVENFALGSPQEAIGKAMNWQIWGTDTWKNGKIIGIVKDFNFKSLHNQIESVVMHIDPANFSTMLIKVKPENFHSTLAYVEQEYRKFEPFNPFEFDFVDQAFDRFYKAEGKLSNLFSLLTFLAIFTAGIGLYGLVRFSIVSRSKELSLRKLLGAASGNLFSLIVRQYIILVVVCLLIATPVAYYLAEQWLDNFAFKVGVNSGVFLTVIISTLFFTLSIVGSQVLSIIRANPAQNLRMD